MKLNIIKTFVLSFIFMLPLFSARAQQITDVRQEGREIVVEFNLKDESLVELYYSANGGVSYEGPLRAVSVDSVTTVKAGANAIVWRPIVEIGGLENDNVRFKLRATPYKKYVQQQKQAQRRAAHHYYWNRSSWCQGGDEMVYIPHVGFSDYGVTGGGFSFGGLTGYGFGLAAVNLGKESNRYFYGDVTVNWGWLLLPWFGVSGGTGIGFRNDYTDSGDKCHFALPLQAGALLRFGDKFDNAMVVKLSINSANYFKNHYYTIGVGWTFAD